MYRHKPLSLYLQLQLQLIAIVAIRSYMHASTTIPGALGKYVAASFLRIQKYYIPNTQRLLLHILPQTQTRHDFRQSINTDASYNGT